ncbi:hypothetical protein ALC62_01892 [Cyphomyrmex costatus]|uniref:Phospholipase A2-like domain-containing protein n=1 Tax=Cyphomyrmex costatus TaxID=456900 RepID=A0A151INU6_9HYME|nr:hypothetical protein ALC62_01892 [Cyphomyrmex costatus]
MYFSLYHRSFDIRELSAEQLQYIPKIVLLQMCGDYIDHVWDRLPEHIGADSDVRRYRRCLKYYNLPSQQTHIDGPAPKIRDCGECQRRARGDAGLNPLDAACREHDIAYSQSNDLVDRHAADKILAEEARKRVTNKRVKRKFSVIRYPCPL